MGIISSPSLVDPDAGHVQPFLVLHKSFSRQVLLFGETSI